MAQGPAGQAAVIRRSHALSESGRSFEGDDPADGGDRPGHTKLADRVESHQTHYPATCFIEEIAAQYEQAEKITLVLDDLNTNNAESFYEKFSPEKAKALMNRFELVHTPKQGSWLNIAEIELNVLWGQCLKRRINDIGIV